MRGWLKVLCGVGFSVAATILLLLAVSRLPGMEITPAYWVVAVICPVLVSAPVCIVLVGLVERNRAMTIELQGLNHRLERMAEQDGLTGLLNRRAFIERVETLRQVTPGWYLMVDVDHFKGINDRYGHDTGDRALQAVARTISEVAREPALCARLGGEEFAVFLPRDSQTEAMAIAGEIRKSVQVASIAGNVRVTVSVGVAGGAEIGSTSHGLKAADQAMYLAKRLGRNQVQIAA